jgi:peroxiredoxin
VARVRRRQRELDEANAALVVVLPEPAEKTAALARKEGWTGPTLGDPDRVAYRAYGLGRLPWHRVITVKTLLLYAGFLLRGRLPQPPGQDVMQQGGDFIVDGQGIVRFAHAGRSPDDRPPVENLIRCLRSLAPPQTAATA